MIVAGSMIGSGIFIVSPDIARLVGCGGWLLAAWLFAGLMTVAAALSYGEMAAMMPRAGGQYVFLREAYSPMWGFLFGWALFLVIQTGTIAAVALGLARYLGVLVPAIGESNWIIPPVNMSANYAFSLSVQQLVAILSIVCLTFLNARGLRLGKIVQNSLTSIKIMSLVALTLVGLLVGWNAVAVSGNFGHFWTPTNTATIRPELSGIPTVSGGAGILGLFIAFCVAQVGSLFSADAWTNVTFVAGEIKSPKRNLPLSLALGTGLVVVLYLLTNVAYLVSLPLSAIQNAPQDRVATSMLEAALGRGGSAIMAVVIVISTIGCNNGLILSGARVYYAMARDGLFFSGVGRLNKNHVPAAGLVLQCIWASLLILPRTRLHDAAGQALRGAGGIEVYGNLYSNLLDYVVFSVLVFYALTIMGLFILRRKRPNDERPYRAIGYPVVPALYVVAAVCIMVVLALYRTQTTWPGLIIVLTGIPVYFCWAKVGRPIPQNEDAVSQAEEVVDV